MKYRCKRIAFFTAIQCPKHLERQRGELRFLQAISSRCIIVAEDLKISQTQR